MALIDILNKIAILQEADDDVVSEIEENDDIDDTDVDDNADDANGNNDDDTSDNGNNNDDDTSDDDSDNIDDDIEENDEDPHDDRLVKIKTDLFNEMSSYSYSIKEAIAKLEKVSISDKPLNEAVNKYIMELTNLRLYLSDYLISQFIGNSYSDNLYMFENVKRSVSIIHTHMYRVFNFKQNTN